MNDFIDDTLGDLALFVRVVNAGGFTAAARLTGTPQPTISRRIAQLEARIGLKLLHRSTRSISITGSGRRVYDHAVTMIAAGEAAASAALAMRTEISGLVRITAPVVLGRYLVSPIVREALSTHPDLRLDVEWTTRRVDLLHDGVDVAVRIGRPTESDAMLTRLGHARRRIFAPPSWSAPDPSVPADLDGAPVVGLGPSTEAPPLVLRSDDQRATVRPDWRMAANDGDLVLDLAESCGYLAILPDFLPPPDWRVLLPDWETRHEINAITAPGRVSVPKIRYVIDCLRARAATQGGEEHTVFTRLETP
ncbi:LysR substrate-binding domain-containing protein [Brevundimonas sp. A19_0]|uniref:LysR family transcriptional regulator n=1 Tax=Brevundimonas sp. A19_0 TaxID=2821087 RepID=UPI001ADBC874|nr:LysR substrate-binding domain-containing protein [Brevundimonas sp. A19_0]MBO9501173.1 LysR family transcriptional regulator [Brevundimonas sp. A19_0]